GDRRRAARAAADRTAARSFGRNAGAARGSMAGDAPCHVALGGGRRRDKASRGSLSGPSAGRGLDAPQPGGPLADDGLRRPVPVPVRPLRALPGRPLSGRTVVNRDWLGANEAVRDAGVAQRLPTGWSPTAATTLV